MLQKKYDKIGPFHKKSILQIAKLIFAFPNKTFHIRMLEKLTHFSTTAIKSAIKELEKYKIIQIEKTPLTTNIKANLEAEEYRHYKIVFNLYALTRSPFLHGLKEFYRPETIVLFGSFAKGEDGENSDIDILIITPRKVSGLGNLIEETEKELKRKIDLITLPSLEKSKSKFKNAVSNGIVLHGYLKVI